jgi:hypothetical protein
MQNEENKQQENVPVKPATYQAPVLVVIEVKTPKTLEGDTSD